MKSIKVSAPGKINLMGEHAIVHGRSSLLSAVNLRATVKLSDSALLNIVSDEPDGYIRHTVSLVCKALTKKVPSVCLTISSTIPSGFHLGSSAAVAVATVGVLYYFFTKQWDLEKINALAYEVEKQMHGNPSGGDNTAVTYGGFLLYQKKSESEKTFKKMSFSLPYLLNHFYLINTGRPKENTGEMVSFVKNQYDKNPDRLNRLFDENEAQTHRVLSALRNSDEKTLIDAIHKGEQTLESMGVVSNTVKPLIRDIEKAGGAAKILGGGGISGGVGFLLCFHTDKKIIEKIAAMFQNSVQSIRLGSEGVRIETK